MGDSPSELGPRTNTDPFSDLVRNTDTTTQLAHGATEGPSLFTMQGAPQGAMNRPLAATAAGTDSHDFRSGAGPSGSTHGGPRTDTSNNTFFFSARHVDAGRGDSAGANDNLVRQLQPQLATPAPPPPSAGLSLRAAQSLLTDSQLQDSAGNRAEGVHGAGGATLC